MSRQRLAFAWIACFAVLFNMLVMPMSGALAQSTQTSAGQVVWGSYCSSSGTKMVAIPLGNFEQKAPQNDDPSSMQHCWCCSGSAPLVAIPAPAPQSYFARSVSDRGVPAEALDSLTPRLQRPSLNPRASPLA